MKRIVSEYEKEQLIARRCSMILPGRSSLLCTFMHLMDEAFEK